MKNKIFFAVLCLAHSVHAYVAYAVCLRKFLPDLNRYHYVVGLGDFHDVILPEDAKQRDVVEAWLKQPGNAGMRVITEDLFVPNVEGRSGMNGYRLSPRKGAFLDGITNLVQASGAMPVNVEHRYGRLIAFGPLRNSSRNISTVAAAQGITVRDLIHEVEHELSCILQFSDGRILNGWYAAEVENIYATMQSLKWYDYANKTVADYVATIRVPLRSYIDNHLLIFDRAILDMKIVHDIVTNCHGKTTCIIAGGGHVDRAESQLKRAGYEVVSRINFQRPFLGLFTSFLPGAAMPHPYPIQIFELNSFLNKIPV